MAGESTGVTSTPLSTGVVPAASGGVKPYTSTANVSSWAQPYVTDLLGTAQNLADKPYEAYGGPLTARTTDLQTSALSGIGALTAPSTQSWSDLGDTGRQKYMSPYIQDVLDPQLEEAKRQAQIANLQNRTQLTKAGAYGGGRGALMESEGQRNLQQNLASITGKGYQTAYEQGLAQFNKEQDQGLASLKAAQDLYGSQYGLGEKQRGIEQEGLASQYQQWQQQQQFPYEQLKFQQSLLSGLPITEQKITTPPPSTYETIMSALSGVATGSNAALNILKNFGVVSPNSTVGSALKEGWNWLSNQYKDTMYGNSLSDIQKQWENGTIDASTAMDALRALNTQYSPEYNPGWSYEDVPTYTPPADDTSFI